MSSTGNRYTEDFMNQVVELYHSGKSTIILSREQTK